jgi:hypothetical protein
MKTITFISLSCMCAFFVSCDSRQNKSSEPVKKDTLQSSGVTELVETTADTVQHLYADSASFSFENFVELFRTERLTQVTSVYEMPGYVKNRIPGFAVRRFMPMSQGSPWSGGVFAKELLEGTEFYLVIYVGYVAVGPGIDELHACTFSREGKQLCDIRIGGSFVAGGPDDPGQECDYKYRDGTMEVSVRAGDSVTYSYFKVNVDYILEKLNINGAMQ